MGKAQERTKSPQAVPSAGPNRFRFNGFAIDASQPQRGTPTDFTV